jgi:lipid-A-disaccharide synthase
VPPRILVSAGEASGDHYAAGVVRHLARMMPGAEFFGCAGAELRGAGVEPVVEAESLAVLGIVEVLRHIPRIYGEYRTLLRAARVRRPDAAILTDSPDFHLRVAARLHRMGVPVFYLIAPQAWAWRSGRARTLRRNVRELHCIFPFEEEFFRSRGVETHYLGHPLAASIRVSSTREQFFGQHGLRPDRPLVALCPGSRRGEIGRHLAPLRDAVERIAARHDATFVLARPAGAGARFGEALYAPLTRGGRVRVIEGATREAMAHADVTLAASGTVVMEAALVGAPVVSFYRVSRLTYWIGRPLVRTPFYTMVNLVAGRRVVPEFIQAEMTGEALAAAALELLESPQARERMRLGLAEVGRLLRSDGDPLEKSAARVAAFLREHALVADARGNASGN